MAKREPAELVPLGRPLGWMPDGGYRVACAGEVHELTAVEGLLWRGLHRHPDGTERFRTRTGLADLGIDDVGAQLEALLARGLAREVELRMRRAGTSFARRVQLHPLHFGAGSTPDEPEAFALAAGEERTLTVSIHTLRRLAGSEHDALLGSFDPGLHEPYRWWEEFLPDLTRLLAAGAAYLDANPKTDGRDRDAWNRTDPSGTPFAARDDTDAGVYARGLLLGPVFHEQFGFMTHISVSVNGFDHRIRDWEGLTLWLAARGAPGDPDDSLAGVVARARREVTLDDPEALVAELVAEQVLMVPTTADELLDLADRTRAFAQLSGIREEPDGSAMLGIDAERPLVTLTAAQYRLWCEVPLAWSLFDAAERAGRAGSLAEVRGMLREVQELCALGALYLDRAPTRYPSAAQ